MTNERASVLEQMADVAEAALLHEAMGKRGAMSSGINPAYPGAKICGFALPIQCPPGDNLMLHQALSVAEPGDVLVATVGGYREAGIWGEIATVAAIERGVRGFITDGSVRDIGPISALGFPVFSAGLSIIGTTKRQIGTLGEPIVFANQRVSAGDVIVADVDGVVVVPQNEIDATIQQAREIQKREAHIIERLRQGELTIDLLNLREALPIAEAR